MLTFRPIAERDVEPLLRLVPSIDPDHRTLLWTRQQLENAVAFQCVASAHGHHSASFAQFARVVEHEGRLVGFVAGHLVYREQAEELCRIATKEAWYSADLAVPVPDNRLAKLNEQLGSCLLITSFFWDATLPSRVELAFADQSLERLTKFFEGHRIVRLYATLLARFEYLIAGLLAVTPAEGKRHLKLEDGFYLLELRSPWKSKGLFRDWGARLLRESEPDGARNLLTQHQRRTGRILHEFSFDYVQATSCNAIPSWSIKEPGSGRSQDAVTGYGGWSREVYARLNIPAGRRNAKLESLQKHFQERPELLVP